MDATKVFISYSWSSQEHEQWVIELAAMLVESGVDVVLDKWELREGQDKYVFMERMVTDPAISKVLVVSDRVYMTKADARRGGVGTESQIISAEIYDKVDQRKFVPIVTELTEDGAPALPTYLRGRIYIDMSSAANRYERFEQLLRWVFDRPLHQKPQLGKPPAYITEDTSPQLGTTFRFRAAVEAVRLGKEYASVAVEDYFDTFAANLGILRVQRTPDTAHDDAIVGSIEQFRPYRDEAIDLLAVVARYRDDRNMYDIVHRWLEHLLVYKHAPADVNSWREEDFDNFRFMLNELFLYVIATLLKSRRYEQTRWLLENKYFTPDGVARRNGGRLEPYDTFVDHLSSINETRNRRLGLRRLSVVSDMLKQRALRNDIRFNDIMQADFVLVVYSVLHFPHDIWHPNTLLFASHGGTSFELFQRAASRRGFGPLRMLFEVESKDDLIARFKQNGERIAWRQLWGLDGIDPEQLMNAAKLESEA